MHNVVVFDTAGKKLTEIPHCRNPRWSSELSVLCEAESVAPDGHLKLKVKRTETVGALTRMLNDPEPEVRANAAMGLARLGPAAEPALLALRAMQQDKAPSGGDCKRRGGTDF